MLTELLEPFAYAYMTKAIGLSILVGITCACLSAYITLKGWSLMGDALSHAIVPGVALAYLAGLPYAAGAFFTGGLAAISMYLVKRTTKLREDAIIGVVFTSFFALGLLLASINPMTVDIQAIVLGNSLTIPTEDAIQIAIITAVTLIIIGLKWKDFTCVFFDINHAKSIGLPTSALQVVFFTLLSATTVAALHTVGACLVIAMLVTPGATAYLMTHQFRRMLILSMCLGGVTSGLGVYISYFINTHPGGMVVILQTSVFLVVFGLNKIRKRPCLIG
ncbi:MAG: metal ABC transporter permease [Candidatus Marinamargulisbacteria bacterium]|nr:metal ABC transporter permease [Candidatus Marinamargulisbacteria bacterium]